MELNLSVFESPLGAVGARAERERQYNEFMTHSIRDIGMMANYIEDTKQYLLYFKVPFADNYKYSKKGYYDVVFLMTPPKTKIESSMRLAMLNAARPAGERKRMDLVDEDSLEDYSFQAFSNSQGFMYTYTFVFNMNKLLIPWIPKSKYSKLALTKPPLIRNPRLLIYYEKSLWHPFFFMKRFKLFSKSNLNQYLDNALNSTYVNSHIMSQEDKEEEYKKIKDRFKEKENKVKSNISRNKEFLNKMETMSRFGRVIISNGIDTSRIPSFQGHFLLIS